MPISLDDVGYAVRVRPYPATFVTVINSTVLKTSVVAGVARRVKVKELRSPHVVC